MKGIDFLFTMGLTPGAAEAHALLHLLNVMEADAALAAVHHDHGLPVVRAQPLRLAELKARVMQAPQSGDQPASGRQ